MAREVLEFPFESVNTPDLGYLSLQVDRGLYSGRLAHIVILAQKRLCEFSDAQVLLMLEACEFVLQAMIAEGSEVIISERKEKLTEEVLDRLDFLIFAPLLSAVVGTSDLIGNCESGESVYLSVHTPSHVLAAMALSAALASVRSDQPEWRSNEGGYFAILAGSYWGLSEAVDQSGGPLRQVAESDRMRNLAARKSIVNQKARAMAEIRHEWLRQQRPGGGFAKSMASRYQQIGVDLSEGGIKNAITRWRKEH